MLALIGWSLLLIIREIDFSFEAALGGKNLLGKFWTYVAEVVFRRSVERSDVKVFSQVVFSVHTVGIRWH